jgi:poly-gamma-glutamate synthesis protein (capsule biosynthesis protein)
MGKRLILPILLLSLLLGCGAQPTPSVTEPTTTTVTEPSTTVTEPEPTVTTPPAPVETTLTLTFTGDCTLGTNQKHTYANSFHEYYDRKGADYFLSNVRTYFEEDDLTLTVWLDEKDRPVSADILYAGRRILSIVVTNFTLL